MRFDPQSVAASLRQLFEPTPCAYNAHLSSKYGAEIWLKREDLTPVRSYKIRGAWNAMNKALKARDDIKSFVCASAGNHAQGVAYACQKLGVKGVIFMPITTPQQKIEKTRIFGGEMVTIKLIGDYFDETLAASREYCAQEGGYFLSPFDDSHVMEGQASVGVEALEQMPVMPDVVVLPVGGGGLSSGLTKWFSIHAPEVKIYYTEPQGGRSLYTALQEKQLVTLNSVDSFVDGAAVARIGEKPFEVLKQASSDNVLACPEDRICVTMLDMLNVEGIVLEPAGALSIDALNEIAHEIKGKNVLCVASGGNFDFERLPEVKERAQRYQGLKKYFILRMPQRPGALRDFLDMLGPEDDIARFEYLKKSARNFGSVLIGIETKAPENFKALLSKMDDAGLTYQDITSDDVLSEFVI